MGTALTVIIPEGIRSLYTMGNDRIEQRSAEHQDYSQTIGLSLVLGFVFMMLVDISQRRSNIGSEKKNGATLTLGLVVHAAGTKICDCSSVYVINFHELHITSKMRVASC